MGIDSGLEAGWRDASAEFIRFLDVSPRTLDTYRKALSRWTGHLKERGMGQPPTRDDIVAYRDWLKASRKPATVNLYLGVVRLFYGRLTARSISRMIKNRLKDAGYDDSRLTAHSLRHTCATLNLLGGGSLEETQQLLRHKDISTTQAYSHALTRAKNNSESRVASAIFGGTSAA
jgi:site-specific recombinase XerD